jgi:hypothetical protein
MFGSIINGFSRRVLFKSSRQKTKAWEAEIDSWRVGDGGISTVWAINED